MVTVCKSKSFLNKGCKFICNPFNSLCKIYAGKMNFKKEIVGVRKYSLFIRKKTHRKSKPQTLLPKLYNANYLKLLFCSGFQCSQKAFDCTEQLCKILSHFSLERSSPSGLRQCQWCEVSENITSESHAMRSVLLLFVWRHLLHPSVFMQVCNMKQAFLSVFHFSKRHYHQISRGWSQRNSSALR